ncbi:MAG: ubiquinone biosynthesis regulatory protein kinase UbiB [Neisseriaceae bacterium]
MRFIRLLKIIFTLHRYGLYNILKEYNKISLTAKVIKTFFFFVPIKHKNKSLPHRTRLAFEYLGPVFVKFGQILSTRQDLIPSEFIVELSKLQNQVSPFPGTIAKQIVETSLKDKIENIFSYFSDEAVASASIAQVHKATLKTNNEVVAVKILRPNIEIIINKDIKVLKLAAWFIEKIYRDGKRLRPQEVVLEFEKIIHAELNFHEEASNATELRRLHKKDSNLIIIPKLYFDYCTDKVLVLEWMDGTPISNLAELQKKHIDLKKLSHNGVTIFYTQVFNYGFFHADMHPGNILCDDKGRYIGLDFGIVGSLSEEDKRYLAINILAFFNRDYKKVALTHIESGWAPKNTSVEEFENAIRGVCEPIFNKPLAQISFGQVLIKLFQVSRRFGIVVQPQLILLQKTIVNVEGLGRLLNPELDLWVTAKPILEKWMRNQMGWRGLIRNIKAEAPFWSYTIPKLPRIFAENLAHSRNIIEQNTKYKNLLRSYKYQNRILILLIIVCIITFWYKL